MRLRRDEMKRFSKKFFPYKDPDRVMEIGEFAEKSEILVKQLKDPITVAAIQKLWSPGIMVKSDLVKMTGESEARVERKMQELRDLGIIKNICIGIHGRGEYGRFIMNVFAWMVLEVIPDDED